MRYWGLGSFWLFLGPFLMSAAEKFLNSCKRPEQRCSVWLGIQRVHYSDDSD